MRITRVFLLVLFVPFIPQKSLAQVADMQSVIGPSPNVASLFKFVDQPISLYTGTCDIKIPIYTFKTGKIEIPISLAYHSAGIKVSENASWTGLGWALNAGGAVTASCYGLPDLTYLNVRYKKSTPDKCDLTSILNGFTESQPDLFYFSFLNQSGEFYLNDSLKIMQIPYSKIKIELFTDSVSTQNWKITNTDGMIYLFEQREINPTYQQTINGTSGGNTIPLGPGRPAVPSVSSPTWFLTKIISPYGDSVMFNYQSYSAACEIFTGETNYFQASGQVLDCAGNPAIAVPANTSNYQLQQIFGYRLSSIVSRNGSIQFITGGNRCDLLGDSYLSEIDVLDNNGTLIKKTTLSYNYLIQSSLYPTAQINCSTESKPTLGYVDPTEPSLSRRLMLMEVDEINARSNQIDGSYKMNYNTSIGLPSKFSAQQDTWGYYNGNGQSSLLQNLGTSGQTVVGIPIPTINGRDPDFTHASQGILTQLTYPTGGSSSFTYELNNYRQETAPGYQINVGGLRIKQINNYDSINNTMIIKNYDYSLYNDGILSSSGVLPGGSMAGLTNSYLTARDLSCPNGTLWQESPVIPMLIVNSNTNYPLTSTHGSTVGYGQVTERTLDQNGYDIGKTVYNFSTPSDQISQNVINNVPNFYNVYPPSVNDFYPFSPSYSNEWMRGLMLSKADYINLGSNNYQLLKQVKNFYSAPHIMDTTHGLVAGYYLNSQMPFTDTCSPSSEGSYNTYSIFKYSNYQIYSEYVQLDSTTTETFDNNGNEVKTPLYYTYDSSNLLPSIIKTVNSKNEYDLSYKKYPLDYIISGVPSNNIALSIQNLQNKNVIAAPIETYHQLSNTDGSNLRTTSAILNTYQTYGPLLDTIFRLDTAAPIIGFIPTSISSTMVVKNGNYSPLIEFDRYDAVGNLIQQRKINDVYHSYLWDYTKTYPIVEAVNADSASIAYSSFEADGSGNWSVSSALRDSITQAVTGTKSYLLSNGSITKTGLNSSQAYIVSYWIKSTNPLNIAGTQTGYPIQGKTISGWTYFEHKIAGQSGVTISGSVNIDELRLYPANALMTTYTYQPLVGISSKCDVDNKVTYYKYDGMNRLQQILDQDHNIIKTIDYHYHN